MKTATNVGRLVEILLSYKIASIEERKMSEGKMAQKTNVLAACYLLFLHFLFFR